MYRFAKHVSLLLFCCLLSTSALAQVGIGTTTPDPNAILELYSGTTPRGLLLPRMNTAQRTTLGSSLGTVHAGMLVADTSNITGGLYVWDGDSWAGVATGGSFVQGTGTTGYLPRWISPTDLGNSLLQDDGTALGLGMTPPPDAKLGIMSNLPYGIQASATSTGSGNWGVYASSAGATGDNYGLYGFAYGDPGNKYGVQGFAMGDGGTKFGIFGSAIGAGTNWAGFFASGDVSIDNGLVLNGIPTGTGSHLLVRRFDNWVNALAFSGSATDVLRGDGTFGPAPSGSQWTTIGSDIYYNTGNVGIGTTAPTQALHVVGGARISSLGAGGGGLITSNGNGDLFAENFPGNITHVLRGDGTFGPAPGGGIWQRNGVSASRVEFVNAGDSLFIGAIGAPDATFKVTGSGTTGGTAARIEKVASAGVAQTAVFIDSRNTGSANTTGMEIRTGQSSGSGQRYGIVSRAYGPASGGAVTVGVDAFAQFASVGEKYAVRADASGAASTNYGVYGTATGGTANWAGYFAQGNVHIQNNLGIGTTTPATLLDVNGESTFRGDMNLFGYRINNLSAPIAGTDAANKNYVDGYTAPIPPGTITNQMLRWNGTDWEATNGIRTNGNTVGIGAAPSANNMLWVNDNRLSNSWPAMRIEATTTPNTVNDGLEIVVGSASSSNTGLSISAVSPAGATSTGLVLSATGGSINRALFVNLGGVRISPLASGTNGALITSDVNGDLARTNFTGNATDVLRGDGTWAAGSGFSKWGSLGLDIFYNSGNVGIGTNSPAGQLHVSTGGNNLYTGLNSYEMLVFNGNGWRSGMEFMGNGVARWRMGQDMFAGGIEEFSITQVTPSGKRFIINSAGNVAVPGNFGIGTTTPGVPLDIVRTNLYTEAVLSTHSSTIHHPVFVMQRSRGTATTPTATQAGDILGANLYRAHNGTAWETTRQPGIEVVSTQNWSATTGGSEMLFSVVPNNATNKEVVMRLDQNRRAYFMNNDIMFRQNGDFNHGVGYYGTIKLYNGSLNLDGPVLYGYNGGALGWEDNASNARDIVLRWTNSGNVGIGTTTPTVPLEIVRSGGFAESHILTYSSAAQYSALVLGKSRGTATTPVATASGDVLGALIFRGRNASGWQDAASQIRADAAENFTATNAGSSLIFSTVPLGSTTAAERLRINHNGNLGIGLTGPSAKLHVFNQATDPVQNVLIASNDNNSSGANGILVSTFNALATTTIADFNSGGTNRLRITGNGLVGIAQTNPQYPLDIGTGITATPPLSRYFHSTLDQTVIPFIPGNVVVSVRATGAFWSTGAGPDGGFYASSDQRIKRIVGVSNAMEDLATLMQIEVTDYRFVDSLSNGQAQVKGVIAQQVKAVYPQAVSTQTNVIPDIYALAQSVSHDAQAKTLSLTMAKDTPLKAGDRVRLITAEGTQVDKTVTAASGNRFTVGEWAEATTGVFVYGREVDDFHIVDYDRLHTLSISAVQELARRNAALTSEVEELKAALGRTDSDKATLQQQLQQVLGRLEAVETQLGLKASTAK